MNHDEMEYTATSLSKTLGITDSRIRQLAKEGVLTKTANSKYKQSAITQYINFLRKGESRKNSDFSELLEEQRYREKKRQNDIEEKLIAPVEALEKALEKTISVWLPILESLPLVLKRNFPELTGDQVTLIKKHMAQLRNAAVDTKIELDD